MSQVPEFDSRSHWANAAVPQIPGSLTPGAEFRRRLLPSSGVHAVLDVGCGPRPVWIGLGLDIARRIGCDPNREALRSARASDGRAHFVCASGTDLPLADGSVDAVTLIAVLTVVPDTHDAQRVIAEALRVVRPGGVVAIADFLYDPRNPAYRDRYAEMGFSGELIARDAQGAILYRARHWRTDEVDSMMDGRADRQDLYLGQVSSRTGNPLTGFEVFYRRRAAPARTWSRA